MVHFNGFKAELHKCLEMFNFLSKKWEKNTDIQKSFLPLFSFIVLIVIKPIISESKLIDGQLLLIVLITDIIPQAGKEKLPE